MSPVSASTSFAGATVLVLTVLLGGCSSPVDSYCSEVANQQQPLSTVVSDGGPAALLDALPLLRQLQEKSPDDVRADWDVVVGRLEALDDALGAAGVAPVDYDRLHPPEGITEDQQVAIEAAARQLATPEMIRALAGVQQQARDVCQTSLTL